MPRKHIQPFVLPLSQLDVAISVDDAACDHSMESFEQIATRLIPRGFGKSKTSAMFEKEARKMYARAR